MRNMKYLIVVALLAVLASLGTALYFMMRDGAEGQAKTSRMARALTVRIAVSVVLFACLLLAWKLGYIQPTGVPLSK